MTKNIQASRSQNCNGCELCVLETQRQAGKIGLEEALIRILKDFRMNSNKPTFSVDIDPRIESQNVEKIKNICPKDVFDIS
ncbi:hypothetical protein JXA34_03865 [Patescibacteria group bacterium]|nr:hypothetical protein [Patescibacteria group bacterium]